MHTTPRPSRQRPDAAAVPQRTCVGCRQVGDATALWRVVADAAGRLHFQTGRRKDPGRGAYVHRQPRCFERALAGGFARSFRRKVCAPGDSAQLAAQLTVSEGALAVEQQPGTETSAVCSPVGGRAHDRPDHPDQQDQDYDS